MHSLALQGKITTLHRDLTVEYNRSYIAHWDRMGSGDLYNRMWELVYGEYKAVCVCRPKEAESEIQRVWGGGELPLTTSGSAQIAHLVFDHVLFWVVVVHARDAGV